MLSKLLILFLLTQCKYSFEISSRTDVILLMEDILNVQNFPRNVLAYLCWSKLLKLRFVKRMSKNGFFVNTYKPSGKKSFLEPQEHQIFFLDLACENSNILLKQANELQLFKNPFTWFVLGSTNDSSLRSLYFGLDSKVFVLEEINPEFHIKSIYKLTENASNFLENDIARWDRARGLSYFNPLQPYLHRYDIQGTKIIISYVIVNPDSMNHLEDYRFRHIDSITKLYWKITHCLMYMLKGTSTEIFTTTWGYRNVTTGKYNGMVGDIIEGAAEIGGSAAFMTADRLEALDYIFYSYPTYMKFIFKAPPLTYVTNIFTLPFQTYVWYSCYLLLVLIFIIIYTIVVWEWNNPLFKEKLAQEHSALRPDIFEVILMELGAITQQGSNTEPKSLSGRIVTIFTFTVLMFLYTSYSANIVALLQSTADSIKTPQDLLNSRIELGVEDIVYARYYMKNVDEPIRKKVYDQKIAPKGQTAHFMTIEEGMRQVQQGFFAFHTELSSGYKVIADTFQEGEKCVLKELEFIKLFPPYIVIRKKSAYKKIFTVGLRKIAENGVQRRESNNIYLKKPECQNAGSNFVSVGLIDCYAAFLIFGIGIGCSWILFVVEIMAMKCQHRFQINISDIDRNVKDFETTSVDENVDEEDLLR